MRALLQRRKRESLKQEPTDYDTADSPQRLALTSASVHIHQLGAAGKFRSRPRPVCLHGRTSSGEELREYEHAHEGSCRREWCHTGSAGACSWGHCALRFAARARRRCAWERLLRSLFMPMQRYRVQVLSAEQRTICAGARHIPVPKPMFLAIAPARMSATASTSDSRCASLKAMRSISCTFSGVTTSSSMGAFSAALPSPLLFAGALLILTSRLTLMGARDQGSAPGKRSLILSASVPALNDIYKLSAHSPCLCWNRGKRAKCATATTRCELLIMFFHLQYHSTPHFLLFRAHTFLCRKTLYSEKCIGHTFCTSCSVKCMSVQRRK